MIQPSSLLGAQTGSLGGLTSGLGASTLTGTGNAGTAGTVPGLTGLTPSPTSLLAASPSAGLPGATPGSDPSSMIQQILSMMMSIISALLATLQQGSGQPALDTGGDPNQIGSPSASPSPAASGGGASTPSGLSDSTTPPPAGPAPTNSGQLIAGINNKTTDPAQKQRLDTTLSKVAKDPDGAKLLQAAEANGYSIEVGDPTKTGSQDHDADSINGVTIPDQKRIVINPNAPDFDKTVVHELVHAATQSDGNSQTEEGMALSLIHI